MIVQLSLSNLTKLNQSCTLPGYDEHGKDIQQQTKFEKSQTLNNLFCLLCLGPNLNLSYEMPLKLDNYQYLYN